MPSLYRLVNRRNRLDRHSSPNLPSRDFEATPLFDGKPGFAESWRDDGWMILKRGNLRLEFFPHPELDPAPSWFSCCFRLDDVGAFFDEVLAAGIPEQATGWPCAHRPKREAWGGTIGALIDPDGSLFRLIRRTTKAVVSGHRDRSGRMPSAWQGKSGIHRDEYRMWQPRLPVGPINADAGDECPENARGCA